MVNPRVRALMRSPKPDREWHPGELETALMLARRPDLVRRSLAQAAAARVGGLSRARSRGVPGASRTIAPGGAGYFGWPAAARAKTAERVMRLRGELIARALLAELGPRPRRGGPRSRAERRRAERVCAGSAPEWYCSAVGRGRGVSVARGRGKECS